MSSSEAGQGPAQRIIVRLTPPGRGAIAVLAVEGPGAVTDVAKLFSPASGQPLETVPPSRVLFGRFGPEPSEEVVVRVRTPESLEIHCHGGELAAGRIESLLGGLGWRPADWSQWLSRQQRDAIRREATAALAEAPTQRTAAILLDQLQGAWDRAIASLHHALAAGNSEMAKTQIERLLAVAPLGLHLTAPWRVVLAGPPNAGKSSLLNALAGFPRAIVHHQPGTTRDVVTLATAIEGWPVLLCDTAGLRQPENSLEAAGVCRAFQQLAQADLVLAVFDGTKPWKEQETLLPELPFPLVVHNKLDLIPAERPPRGPGIWTSAVTGEGVEDLLHAIAHRLVPQPPRPGEAVPFRQSQIAALRSALDDLVQQNVPGAMRRLVSILEAES